MAIYKNTKDTKFDDKYIAELKSLSLILDGTKSKNLETSLTSVGKTTKEIDDKNKENGRKADEVKALKNISQLVEGAKREKARLNGSATTAMTDVITDKSGLTTDDGAFNSFRGKQPNGTATTNQ